MPDLNLDLSPNRVAVIDIGSNSVRLVVYDGAGRSPLPVFNEKILCGLGRGLAATGRLSDEGYARCLKVLPRLTKIAHDIGVDHLDCIATAAVREASNGPELIKDIKRVCGLNPRVLTGAGEAKLSALGVISGSPFADGLVGDLGGGSMELIALKEGSLAEHVSLPLGPLRQWELISKGRTEAIQLIDENINNLKWLDDIAGKSLYVIGGAWRSLAKMHMDHVDYPLHVIHHYEIPIADALSFTDYVSKIPMEQLENIKGISPKRLETLPYAALLLNRLLLRTAPLHLVFSAYSIREGCLFERLPDDVRALDPLIEACKKASRIKVDDPIMGDVLANWVAPAFADGGKRDRLRLAACYISDVGRGEHPDYRADHAMMRVLRYPYVGVTHNERAFIALSVATRYGTVIRAKRSMKSVKKLLSKKERAEAKALGCAIRVAYNISGGVNSALVKFKLSRKGHMITLHYPADLEFMIGEIAEKRIKSLADQLKCQWQLVVI